MNRVGVEATGKPFDAINSVGQSLDSGNINPMVNMGAIVMCSLIHGRSYDERFQRLLGLTRRLARDHEIDVDEAVYQSEKSHGSKNQAFSLSAEIPRFAGRRCGRSAGLLFPGVLHSGGLLGVGPYWGSAVQPGTASDIQ